MTEAPNIAKYRRSDEADAVRMLLGKLQPSEREAALERRLARWRWQYYDNPNNPGGEPLIWVARVGGAFAGMVATIPVKVRTPKGRVLGMWGVDFIGLSFREEVETNALKRIPRKRYVRKRVLRNVSM